MMNEKPEQEYTAADWITESRNQLMQGDFVGAEQSARKAVALDATPGTRFALVMALAENENFAEAREQAALIPNDTYEAPYAQGIIHALIAEYDEAAECFGRAGELAPDDANVISDLGSALLYSGKVAEAEAAYRKALAIAPNEIMCYINLGNLLAQKEEKDEAIQIFLNAIKLEPESVDFRYNIANTFVNFGWIDESVALLEEAVTMSPSSCELYLALQAVHTHAGNDAKALESLVRGLEAIEDADDLSATSDARDLTFQLALLTAEQGELEGAMELFEKLIEAEPDETDVYSFLLELQLVTGNEMDKEKLGFVQVATAEEPFESIFPDMLALLERAVKADITAELKAWSEKYAEAFTEWDMTLLNSWADSKTHAADAKKRLKAALKFMEKHNETVMDALGEDDDHHHHH